jgi:hypothetical protein
VRTRNPCPITGGHVTGAVSGTDLPGGGDCHGNVLKITAADATNSVTVTSSGCGTSSAA